MRTASEPSRSQFAGRHLELPDPNLTCRLRRAAVDRSKVVALQARVGCPPTRRMTTLAGLSAALAVAAAFGFSEPAAGARGARRE